MEPNCIKILLADNSTDVGLKISQYLRRSIKPSFQVWHYSCDETLCLLTEKSVAVDLLIIVLIKPVFLEKFHKIIKQAAKYTPVIAITNKEADALAREVIYNGAADVVIKERFDAYPKRLLDAIEFSIIRDKALLKLKENNANEIHYHKRMLHWMTGGYSVETEASQAIEAMEIIKAN